MSIRPPANSRFGITPPIVTEDGIETFGLLTRYSFLDRENLQDTEIKRMQITPEFAYRADLLANKIYGYTSLQWVLILFNHVQNPLMWPEPNSVVEYPSPDAVLPKL